MMKTRPQITIAEPRIRIPAWRSDSPKKRKTRPEKTPPTTEPPKRVISPRLSSQPLGTVSQPVISSLPARPGARNNWIALRSARAEPGRVACLAPRSPDRLQFRMRREQGLGEDVVEGKDAHEGDHDRLVHRLADPRGAAGGGHPLIGADDRDDRP